MSSESPIISSYRGLEVLEENVKLLNLRVSRGYGELDVVAAGESLLVNPVELRDLGLELDASLAREGLCAGVVHADLELDEVDLVVIADGTFLREREVIARCPVSEVEDRVRILNWRQARPRALEDKTHGFRIGTYVVLNREVPHRPLRPRRKGTVLATASFSVRLSQLAKGLEPLPLTDEIRGSRIPKEAVLWVEVTSDLLDAESLDEAVSIYLDEEIYADLGRLRTQEAKLIQTAFAIDALGQLVHLLSREIAGRTIDESDAESIVGKFMHSQLRAVLGDRVKDGVESLRLIQSDPALVVAQLTAQQNFRSQVRKVLHEDEGPEV